MCRCAIGIDFGTLSARALVVDVATGRELGTAVMEYPHGVMDVSLPDGTPLPPDFALAHPADYTGALSVIVPAALANAGIAPADVIGIGVDGTNCTVLPITSDGTPLCLLPEFAHNPHAYAKLWKHHAAQPYANAMTRAALTRGEGFMRRYGGKISSEWLFPKLWETLDNAPDVYRAAAFFVDMPDYIVHSLTGGMTRSACLAGYKALWSAQDGYPSEDYLASLCPGLRHAVGKLAGDVLPVGSRAGALSAEGAALTGLLPGTPVGVATSDAHVALPAAGVTEPGTMLMIMGTSSVHIVLGNDLATVPGICGTALGGVVPGLWGFEAGQCCVGDHFDWFVKNAAPAYCRDEADAQGVDLHTYLTQKAACMKPGESGLIALDWWNGNRSVLNDASLTGLMLGMTLTTPPQAMYRALMEATAYGTRMIVENFTTNGIEVNALAACGGISIKNPFLMQLYADVLGRPIRVARSAQTPALGSAILGAVAAGAVGGGYETIQQAAGVMGGLSDVVYVSDPAAHRVYDALYAEYAALHDLFGRGGSDVMRRLKALRWEVMA